MLFQAVATLLVAAASTQAQSSYDALHNATVLWGTWSSGSGAVLTGPGFANPGNTSFTYPNTTGISYSFTSDGFYEIARYRFVSNGSEPNCITGVMNWAHGTYQFQPNGSLTMTPFGDGYQQIQDPCGAVSNFMQNYNNTELYQNWNIYIDTKGYRLQLYQYDGSLLAPQYLITTVPTMLPTRSLRNVTGTVADTVVTGVNSDELFAKPKSGAAPLTRRGVIAAGVIGVVSLAAGSMLL